jgi:anthranilate synthase/phosphoribosyltransferase
MILLIDNYDSFTHNLYQYLREITPEEVKVVRNDAISVGDISAMNPSAIIISPGPGRPEDAGISEEAILHFMGHIPILGVCLGHQAMVHALGGRVVGAARIVHGKAEDIWVDGKGIFRSIQSPARFTRYHSLAADEETLPAELEITARSADGQIMGVRHKEYVMEGVQFHPESIASEEGKKLLRNFLNYRRESFDAVAALGQIMAGRHLGRTEASQFMDELTEGNLNDIQIAGFLAALGTKGVTPEEIAGCAGVLQKKRVAIRSLDGRPCLDIVGTGGDGKHTFNISSMAALVASAAGARVAKHGNKAVSSQTGASDFFAALGLEIQLSAAEAQAMLNQNDFAFLYAPTYHSAMRFAAPARRALRVKTLMNLMGPLVNPAGAACQLIGVYSEDLVRPMAEAARLLGTARCLVVHGMDGLDEVSVCAPTRMVLLGKDGEAEDFLFDASSLGIPVYPEGALQGGDAAINAGIAKVLVGLSDESVLEGGGLHPQALEAIRQAVLVNAGAALMVYGSARDMASGYALAKATMESGKVGQKILASVQMSHALFGTGGRL